jgi:hypothetical protein
MAVSGAVEDQGAVAARQRLKEPSACAKPVSGPAGRFTPDASGADAKQLGQYDARVSAARKAPARSIAAFGFRPHAALLAALPLRRSGSRRRSGSDFLPPCRAARSGAAGRPSDFGLRVSGLRPAPLFFPLTICVSLLYSCPHETIPFCLSRPAPRRPRGLP